jgi:uncharacterized protein (TIGR02246 family)
MGATTPDGLGELIAAAYKANDAEAIRDLYEEDAVLANSVAGYTAVGRDAIIEKHKENFALEIAWDDGDTPVSVEVGDYVISHVTFQRHVTLPDGTHHYGEGRSTVVVKRGSDGTWRFLIDHA